MTGAVIVAIAILLALGFGLYRRAVDGRVRVPQGRDAGTRLDAARLGDPLGAGATFVQFSSAACAPCRVTSRLLAEVSADAPELAHIEIDAEGRLDLVDQLGITRTPTVLLLDAEGIVRNRIVGAPRKQDVLQALQQISHPIDPTARPVEPLETHLPNR